ncbi:hypothetical protein CYMTET_22219 [Cymbomonas tetramitiformis]|uniref:Myosin motor domain-containing protein n=1 Tax=Cymbomonas tetramitiformis TaxID=36881 RepID=A0AAE0G0D8_9CHLO|nr:hypothetical protein CYMTET_22219 [Cymbomonas tetramitiformis]
MSEAPARRASLIPRSPIPRAGLDAKGEPNISAARSRSLSASEISLQISSLRSGILNTPLKRRQTASSVSMLPSPGAARRRSQTYSELETAELATSPAASLGRPEPVEILVTPKAPTPLTRQLHEFEAMLPLLEEASPSSPETCGAFQVAATRSYLDKADAMPMKLCCPERSPELEVLQTDDLVTVPEPEGEPLEDHLLRMLETRCQLGRYHTFAGPVLLSINPLKDVEQAAASVAEKYFHSCTAELPPHVFSVADRAYRGMLRTRVAQAIMLYGESGSGKTESAKQIMSYIFEAAGRIRAYEGWSVGTATSSGVLVDCIMAAGTVLEALGNSKTPQCDNASRFGKYTEIFFGANGQPVGACIKPYLLEKTRLIQQAGADERSYHIFYQMLLGVTDPAQRSELGLLDSPAMYTYLEGRQYSDTEAGAGHGAASDMEEEDAGAAERGAREPLSAKHLLPSGGDDQKQWAETHTALLALGLSQEEIKDLLKVLSAVLLLGNITLGRKEQVQEHEEEQAEITPKGTEYLRQVADLLGLPTRDLRAMIMHRNLKVGQLGNARSGSNPSVSQRRSDIIVINSLPQAEAARDSMAKVVYQRAFAMLTLRANKRMDSGQAAHSAGVIGTPATCQGPPRRLWCPCRVPARCSACHRALDALHKKARFRKRGWEATAQYCVSTLRLNTAAQ